MSTSFDHVQDAALRAKLEAVTAEHEGRRARVIPPEESQFPRYVFARGGRVPRPVGTAVRVRNGLDEETRGGTVVARVGRAYVVDLGDMQLLVHEPEDSWVPFASAEDVPT